MTKTSISPYVPTEVNLNRIFNASEAHGSKPAVHICMRHSDRDAITGHYSKTTLNTAGVVHARSYGKAIRKSVIKFDRELSFIGSSPVGRCKETLSYMLSGAHKTELAVTKLQELDTAGGALVKKEMGEAAIRVYNQQQFGPFVTNVITNPTKPYEGMKETAIGVKQLLSAFFRRKQRTGSVNFYCTHDVVLAIITNHLTQTYNKIHGNPLITKKEDLWIPKFSEITAFWKDRKGTLFFQHGEKTLSLTKRELKSHFLI
ncbi:MAG: hypothetical protein S4CHLAM37_05460 [Chlamydiia bacterium]|nr:hypothetical protein [Chlamydiia bacterium]